MYSACSTLTHQFSQASACYSKRGLSFAGQIIRHDIGKILCIKFRQYLFKTFYFAEQYVFPALLKVIDKIVRYLKSVQCDNFIYEYNVKRFCLSS